MANITDDEESGTFELIDNLFDVVKKKDYSAINSTDETYTDSSTGFIWQKNIETYSMTILDAIKYVSNLNKTKYAGYTTWSIPTKDELLALVDNEVKNDYSECGTLMIKEELAKTMKLEKPIFWALPYEKDDDIILPVVLFDAGIPFIATAYDRFHVRCVVK